MEDQYNGQTSDADPFGAESLLFRTSNDSGMPVTATVGPHALPSANSTGLSAGQVGESSGTTGAREVPRGVLDDFAEDADASPLGGAWDEPEDEREAIARTLFDTAASRDNAVTVVMEGGAMRRVPTQALLRIVSKDPDQVTRTYLGVVTQGPFAEPNGLRADSPLLVTVTIKGVYLPPYHGRAQVELLGEEKNGVLTPPRFRPLPNSPAFPLTGDETRRVLKLDGDIVLGRAEGHEDLTVGFPSDKKSVLPRHLALLGSTGSGKSTTLSGLIDRFQRADIATVVIDVEGEYAAICDPTTDDKMGAVLAERGVEPHGVEKTRLLHLVGRDTRNDQHRNRAAFTLAFDRLPIGTVCEILGLTDAQDMRLRHAYDVTKVLLDRLHIYPADDADRQALLELDETETGYPKMTLAHLQDVTLACTQHVKDGKLPPAFACPDFATRDAAVRAYLQQAVSAPGMPGHWTSWVALLGRLHRLHRLGVFDSTVPRVSRLDFISMVEPGRVTLIDLSDTDSPEVRNLVIAELLRGVQEAQDACYVAAVAAGEPPPRTMVVIEEAHEFLSRERIRRMQGLFEQVARIARRGRKRWLGLCFVSQLPQHLPDEILALVNNFVLHKISDPDVLRRLKQTIPGVDEGLWSRLPGLAPGQAVVSFTSMARPVMVAIDPTPCRLLLVD